MKHPWRQPAFSSDPSGPNNSWMLFVCDPHLELLMELVDMQRRGVLMSREDAEHYAIIKEQAETFMARAKAEHWTEEDKRARMLASQSSNLVG